MIDIEALRELEQAATKGPWGYCHSQVDTKNHTIRVVDDNREVYEDCQETGGAGVCGCLEACEEGESDNAALIAAARNALPGLLNEIERLREALADSCCTMCGGMPGEADGTCKHCLAKLNLLASHFIGALKGEA